MVSSLSFPLQICKPVQSRARRRQPCLQPLRLRRHSLRQQHGSRFLRASSSQSDKPTDQQTNKQQQPLDASGKPVSASGAEQIDDDDDDIDDYYDSTNSNWRIIDTDEEIWAPFEFPKGSGNRGWPTGKDPRIRYQNTKVPRDQWLRPIVDLQGIYDRISWNGDEATKRVEVEYEANVFESRQALRFTVIYLVIVPLLVGTVFSRVIANPLLSYIKDNNPEAFALTEYQKVEAGKQMRKEELRLRMDAAIGRTPPLTDSELLVELHHEAVEYAQEKRKENEQGIINLASDILSAMVFLFMLITNSFGRGMLFRTIGRVAEGLSDTAKAFIIILTADILLGYHSEEGWRAAVTLVAEHYGFEVQEGPITFFVAFVPVTIDTCFKYWIFQGLTRQAPSAAVTLKEMDRH